MVANCIIQSIQGGDAGCILLGGNNETVCWQCCVCIIYPSDILISEVMMVRKCKRLYILAVRLEVYYHLFGRSYTCKQQNMTICLYIFQRNGLLVEDALK